MRTNLRHPTLVAALASVLLAGALVATLITITAAAPPGPVLRDVSAARLEHNGVHLLSPNNQKPVIDKATAGRLAALRGRPGASTPVREAVLARVVQDTPAMDRLCWVVSLDPTGWFVSHGPAAVTRRSASFFVVYIDAASGQWLGSDAGDVP
jgi:hypothetical protein